MSWSGGKLRGFLAFLAIALVLHAGLGWAAYAALRVEDKQRLAAANSLEAENLYLAKKERADRMRLALWRLDSRMSPALAREESRPFPQYFARYAPFPALDSTGVACAPGERCSCIDCTGFSEGACAAVGGGTAGGAADAGAD